MTPNDLEKIKACPRQPQPNFLDAASAVLRPKCLDAAGIDAVTSPNRRESTLLGLTNNFSTAHIGVPKAVKHPPMSDTQQQKDLDSCDDTGKGIVGINAPLPDCVRDSMQAGPGSPCRGSREADEDDTSHWTITVSTANSECACTVIDPMPMLLDDSPLYLRACERLRTVKMTSVVHSAGKKKR